MKKKLLSAVLTLVMVGGVALQPVVVQAYKDPVYTGQVKENENNDSEEDATRFYQSGTSIYPISGTFDSVEDMDYYVYESKTTQKRSLTLGYSSRIGVPGSTVFLFVKDVTTDTVIHDQSMPTDKTSRITFDAEEGHDYIIAVSLDGTYDELQASINYFKEKFGHGPTYVLSVK